MALQQEAYGLSLEQALLTFNEHTTALEATLFESRHRASVAERTLASVSVPDFRRNRQHSEAVHISGRSSQENRCVAEAAKETSPSSGSNKVQVPEGAHVPQLKMAQPTLIEGRALRPVSPGRQCVQSLQTCKLMQQVKIVTPSDTHRSGNAVGEARATDKSPMIITLAYPTSEHRAKDCAGTISQLLQKVSEAFVCSGCCVSSPEAG
jgi:hypothetical protein